MSAAMRFVVSGSSQGPDAEQVPKVLLDTPTFGDDPDIITNAVLFSFCSPPSSSAGAVGLGSTRCGLSPGCPGGPVNVLLLIAALHGARPILLITAPILFPVAMKLGIDRSTSASS